MIGLQQAAFTMNMLVLFAFGEPISSGREDISPRSLPRCLNEFAPFFQNECDTPNAPDIHRDHYASNVDGFEFFYVSLVKHERPLSIPYC
ncbi:hypothetical protein LCM4573_16580 [Rhizobium sp. LCM 4573]|nr:hypothetical protein LCM4573_16580 [Rhizobium sp. LCM 4573]